MGKAEILEGTSTTHNDEVKKMQVIDNINSTVKEDLQSVIHRGSKLSIAAACFSIYAYRSHKQSVNLSEFGWRSIESVE